MQEGLKWGCFAQSESETLKKMYFMLSLNIFKKKKDQNNLWEKKQLIVHEQIDSRGKTTYIYLYLCMVTKSSGEEDLETDFRFSYQ